MIFHGWGNVAALPALWSWPGLFSWMKSCPEEQLNDVMHKHFFFLLNQALDSDLKGSGLQSGMLGNWKGEQSKRGWAWVDFTEMGGRCVFGKRDELLRWVPVS